MEKPPEKPVKQIDPDDPGMVLIEVILRCVKGGIAKWGWGGKCKAKIQYIWLSMDKKWWESKKCCVNLYEIEECLNGRSLVI